MTRPVDLRLKWLAPWLLLLLCACQREPLYPPLAPGSVVLAFGDSVTYGTGANKGEDFPSLLAQKTGWKIINAGIPGDTAENARSRIGALLRQHQPHLVLVELGGNDFLRRRSPELVKADLRSTLAETIASGAITVLIAVPRISVLRATVGALSDSPLYRELAQETEVLLVSDLFSEIVSDPSLRADAIHPNAMGYQRFANGLLKKFGDVGLFSSTEGIE